MLDNQMMSVTPLVQGVIVDLGQAWRSYYFCPCRPGSWA